MATAAISIATGFVAQTVGNWLKPTQVIESGGLQDLSSPKSNYGIVIPQCWGKVGLTGNLFWATDKIERSQKKRRGKGGGGTVEKTKTYYGNLGTLYAYCPANPALEFERVWFNGKIVYSIHGDAETLANSSDFANQYMRFYLGSSTQNPDPLLESTQPVATYDYGLPHDPTERANAITALGLDPNAPYTPAYRYRVYSVCEELPLTEWGNNFPTIKSEIRFNDNCTIAQIVSDICLQSGLLADQFEMLGLDQTISGFYLDRVMAAKEALNLLQQAYFFDIVDAGNKLKFIAKSIDRPIINIPFEDLAARESGQKRPVSYSSEPEFVENLPEEVEVNFINPNLNYQTDNVKARSQVAKTKKKQVYQLPIVLNESEAQSIADKMLHLWFLESEKVKFSLPPAYLFLEVSDRVNIEGVGTIQLTKIRLGANRLMKCEGKIFSPSTPSNLSRSVTVETGGYNSPATSNSVTSQGNTNLYVLDIPLIEDSDDDYGVYVTANGGANWKECSIYISNDNSRYEYAGALTDAGGIGTLTALSPLTVVLASGELESVTSIDLDAGLNKILIGEEILQYETATLIATNTYELTGLRRGLRGTENYQTHNINERAIALSGDNAVIAQLPGVLADLNQTRYFKAVSPGQSLDAVNPLTLSILGLSLRPYAPINVAATKDEFGNITITWDRRDRHAGDRSDIENFPLSETREEYLVLVLDNLGDETRSISSYIKQHNYSASQQIEDFSSVQSSITVKISQVSSEYGNGEFIEAVLTPGFVAAIPSLTSFVPVSGDEGDTVTVTGYGLAGLTEININGVAQDSLAVASDAEASFVVATGTTSGLITAVAPGGSGTSNIAFILGGVGGHIIQDANNSFAVRNNLKFTGNVSLTDDDVTDTTIVDISGGNSASSGTFGQVTATTANLNQGDFEDINLDMAAIALIREITTTHNARLRLFGTESDRTGDNADVTTQLDIDEAIDIEFSSNLNRRFSKGVITNNLDLPLLNTIYGKLFNNSGAANTLDLDIKYYAIAVINDLENNPLAIFGSALIGWYYPENENANNWNDSSSYNNHLFIDNRQIKIVNPRLNNKNIIRFDGSISRKYYRDFANSECTIYILFDKPTSGGNEQQRIISSSGSTQYDFSNNGVFHIPSTGNNGVDLSNNPILAIKKYNTVKDLSNFNVGALNTIINNNGNNTYYGDLAEIIIVDRITTTTEDTAIENYLKRSWGGNLTF